MTSNPTPKLLPALLLCLLAPVGCGEADGDDDDGGDSTGGPTTDPSGTMSTSATTMSTSATSAASTTTSDTAGDPACAAACATAGAAPGCAEMGFNAETCELACDGNAECAACLEAATDCGLECATTVCMGTAETTNPTDPTTDPTDPTDPTVGDSTSEDTGELPPQACDFNATCGEFANCVACDLTDEDGYCVEMPVVSCDFDTDCAADEVCGYLVGIGDFACGPAAACD